MIETVCETIQGFEYRVNQHGWLVPAFKIAGNDWVCLVPEGDETSLDASLELSRILAALECPSTGDVRIFNHDTTLLNYTQRLELRKSLGYVQSTGGVLSNRTVIQNLEYPLLIHAPHMLSQMKIRIGHLLDRFGLTQWKDYRPHEIDGRTRWKTCVARALIMEPRWIVMEEVGDWNYSGGSGLVWSYFQQQLRSRIGLAVCLSQYNHSFIDWFKTLGGRIIAYQSVSEVV